MPTRKTPYTRSKPLKKPRSPITMMVSNCKLIDGPKLESFLKEKIKRKKSSLFISDLRKEGDIFYFECDGIHQSLLLKNLSGILFDGQKLVIESKAEHEYREELSPLLEEFLKTRVTGTALILDSVEGKRLGKHVFDFTDKVFSLLLLEIIKTKFPLIVAISFASNNLTSLKYFGPLKQMKHVVNLSFANNNLTNLKELEYLNPSISEIILKGNKFQYSAVDIKKIFSEIQFLDQAAIPKDLQVDVTKDDRFKIPTENFFDSDVTRQTVEGFISQYFAAFDTNRDSLIHAYSPDALFSIATTKSCDRFKQLDHNLQNNEPIQVQHGSNVLIALKTLPESKTLEYRIDSWQPQKAPAHIFIAITGKIKFDYTVNFSKTLILVPNANQQPVISNDSFMIDDKVKKFSVKTKLNMEYSEQCLSDNEWDEIKAYKAFQHLKSARKFPAKAFK